MSYTIASAIAAHVEYSKKAAKFQGSNLEDVQDRACMVGLAAKHLLEEGTPEEIREYLDITRSILNDLEKRMNELEQVVEHELEQVVEPAVEEKPPVATKTKGASRVKRSKKVDAIVENVKGKRDVDAGTKAKIDEMKAQDVKPAKVAQEKRKATKKEAPAAKAKTEKRTHEGMSYSEIRKQVSERKAQLNKADQQRMVKAGLKNNTWDGAIESLTWLNRYFPTTSK